MKLRRRFAIAAAVAGTLASAVAVEALATTHNRGQMGGRPMMGRGLMMPMMDPARGRKLFASKGCVVCHSVNGVGGKDAPAFDASGMSPVMNPFEFAARMWRGAEAMIVLQRETLGAQIELTGAELADIIAFTHDPEEQHKFSEDDVPEPMLGLIEHSHAAGVGAHHHMHGPEDEHHEDEHHEDEHHEDEHD